MFQIHVSRTQGGRGGTPAGENVEEGRNLFWEQKESNGATNNRSGTLEELNGEETKRHYRRDKDRKLVI